MAFTVTTWNVENFSSNADGFQAKLAHLTSALQSINPDVVALQEVLDLPALDALASALHYHALAAAPDGRGIRVAFLLRGGPPLGFQEITAWRLPAGVIVQELNNEGAIAELQAFSRPALRVTIARDGSQYDIVNAHLKSKLLTFPGGHFSTSDESLRAHAAYCALTRGAAETVPLRAHANDLLEPGAGLQRRAAWAALGERAE